MVVFRRSTPGEAWADGVWTYSGFGSLMVGVAFGLWFALTLPEISGWWVLGVPAIVGALI